MEKYIVTINDNRVNSLDVFDGVVYTSLNVIIATLAEIKDMCDSVGIDYSGFEEIVNA